MSGGGDSEAVDEEQLRALGIRSEFERSITFWRSFALGFTYLSPVVGAYSLFNFGLATAGPPMMWWFVIAGAGQLLVALVFGEVVSQFPIAGGIYPWARRLVGRRWSWIVGWVYAWALFITIAGVAIGAPPILQQLLGFEASPASMTIAALLLLACTAPINLMGTRVVGRVAFFGFLCEVIGALLVGAYLLVFSRHQSMGVIVQTFGAQRNGAYWPAFVAAAVVGLVCCYGFEACGDVAEETPNPGRAVPRAMQMTIYVGISVAIFASLALILAVPDLERAVHVPDSGPLEAALDAAFGHLGSKLVLLVVLISFVSCALSLQAAASRVIYSYARDRMIVGAARLSRISPKHRVPTASLIVAVVVPAVIDCIGFAVKDAMSVVFSFAAAGMYIAFQMVVAGALFARWRGWQPRGSFRLGRYGWLVNLLALAYGLVALTILMWPTGDAAWYVNYATPLAVWVVVGLGIFYMAILRPYQHSHGPAGDAWSAADRKAGCCGSMGSRPSL
jgi:amino acid transporter